MFNDSNCRRLIKVSLDVGMLINMVRTGWNSRGRLSCVEGVPPGAIFVGMVPGMGDLAVDLLFTAPGAQDDPLYLRQPIGGCHIHPSPVIFKETWGKDLIAELLEETDANS